MPLPILQPYVPPPVPFGQQPPPYRVDQAFGEWKQLIAEYGEPDAVVTYWDMQCFMDGMLDIFSHLAPSATVPPHE